MSSFVTAHQRNISSLSYTVPFTLYVLKKIYN